MNTTTAILEQNRSGSYVRRSPSDIPHRLINSDLLRFVEYGKTLVHNTFEMWREITGAAEVIERLFETPTLQEQIKSVQHQIQSLRNELSTMKQHMGDRSFVEYRIREKEAELQELQIKLDRQALKDEDDLFGENPQPIKVIGNVVTEVIPQPQPEPREIPQFQVVDTAELQRLEAFFEAKSKIKKFSNRQHVFYYKGPKLTRTTMYRMINQGIPKKIVGLNNIPKEQNYQTRLNLYQTLEAYVRILDNVLANDERGKPINNIEQITAAMLQAKRAEIQQFKDSYQ